LLQPLLLSNFVIMKSKFILITSILIAGILFLSAGTLLINEHDPSLDNTRINLTLRAIGHQLLLHSGNSTSIVKPVKQINESTFRIEFQSSFTFMPDSLVKIVHRSLTATGLSGHYIVNVLNCDRPKEIVYGYEFLERKKESISCVGRIQPMGCYAVQIIFPEIPTQSKFTDHYVWIIALSAMALIGFIGGKTITKKEKIESVEGEKFIVLGKFTFYYDRRLLKYQGESIELSDKESRLLKVFATSPNEIIERDRLLKEVWEDDGVFVGRSLDVFVSKLRKRLQSDVSIRIVNIHGKGYKLETGITEV
jgi:DNA-binding winged helix-turn-helix (wHTH) protein